MTVVAKGFSALAVGRVGRLIAGWRSVVAGVVFALAVSAGGASAASAAPPYVYVANSGSGSSGSVSAFSIGSGGGLTAVSGSPFAAGTFPVGVVVSPDSDLALTNVPGNMTVNATGPAGAVVTYTPPTATDEGGETPTVGCLPASGSLFPIGLTTTVTCTATDVDDSNSPVHASFTVTVTGALGQLQALLASVGALPSSTAKTVLSVQLGDAIAAEQAGNTGRVCLDLFGLVRAAEQEESYGQLTAAQATSIINAADQIAAVVGCAGVDPAPVVLRPVVKPDVNHSGHKRHHGSRVQT